MFEGKSFNSEMDYLLQLLHQEVLPKHLYKLAYELVDCSSIKELKALSEKIPAFKDDQKLQEALKNGDFESAKERLAFLLIERFFEERRGEERRGEERRGEERRKGKQLLRKRPILLVSKFDKIVIAA